MRRSSERSVSTVPSNVLPPPIGFNGSAVCCRSDSEHPHCHDSVESGTGAVRELGLCESRWRSEHTQGTTSPINSACHVTIERTGDRWYNRRASFQMSYAERCESGRIGRSRKPLSRKGPWVRIPPSPPYRTSCGPSAYFEPFRNGSSLQCPPPIYRACSTRSPFNGSWRADKRLQWYVSSCGPPLPAHISLQ